MRDFVLLKFLPLVNNTYPTSMVPTPQLTGRGKQQFIRLTYRAIGEGFPGRRMGDFGHPRRSLASKDGGFLMAAWTGALLHLCHLSPPRGPEATCNYRRLESNTLDGVVSYSGSHDLPTRTKGQRSASPAEVMVGEQAQLDF